MIYTEDGQNSPPIAEVGQRIFNLIEYVRNIRIYT
jgi:hypothetical protein